MKTKAQILNIRDFPYIEYDDRGYETYCEVSDGEWLKRKFDDHGNITYHEDHEGNFWDKKLIPNVTFPY